MTDKALAIVAFGARGTGKTAWVKQQLRQMAPSRLIVWDYKHDPSLKDLGKPYTDLAQFIAAMSAPTFQLRYLVNHDLPVHDFKHPVTKRKTPGQFSLFCMAAFEAGNLTMFPDELGEVTRSNGGPPAWKKCVNVGRDYEIKGIRKALTIIGANQRPAEVDKTFISNCDIIHSGRLGDVAEARKYAASWGCDPVELANMADLTWIEVHRGTPGVIHGTLTFGNTKAPPRAKEVKKSAPAKRASKGPARRGPI
jgi:hypothetical protein